MPVLASAARWWLCAWVALAAMPAMATEAVAMAFDEAGEATYVIVDDSSGPSISSAARMVEPLDVDGWETYESWGGQAIRSDRWSIVTDRALEARREVFGSHLLMRYRLEIPTSRGNVGGTGAMQRIHAANAVLMSRISADFQIDDYEVVGCSANLAVGTRVRPAAIDLAKFNDGTSIGPSDQTGDHFVRVIINREASSTDPVNVLTAQAFVFRCIDPVCGNALSTVFTLDMGKVILGEPFSLRAVWDKPNSRFIVGLNGNPDVILSYPPSRDVQPARLPFASIRMQNVNANCAAHPSVTDSKIKVREVRTNASAVVP